MPLGLSGPVALALVALGGSLLGAFSGLLVAVGRIQAFIATLAMMVFARGLAKELSLGQKITNYVTGADGSQRIVEYPAWFSLLDSRVLGDSVAVVTLVFLAVAALAFAVLTQLRAGRYLYAVGGNLEGAELAGRPGEKDADLRLRVLGLLRCRGGDLSGPRRKSRAIRRRAVATSSTRSRSWCSAGRAWPEAEGASVSR